jgi:hypothetical protein
VIGAWLEQRPAGSGRFFNYSMFKKRRPRVDVFVGIYRTEIPSLNKVSLELPAAIFDSDSGPERLLDLARVLTAWSSPALVEVWHSRATPLSATIRVLDQMGQYAQSTGVVLQVVVHPSAQPIGHQIRSLATSSAWGAPSWAGASTR